MTNSKVILDTDILSDLLKGANQSVANRARAYLTHNHSFTFTTATSFEIIYGLLRRNATAQLSQFLSVIEDNEEITPQAEDFHLAAEISAALANQGTPIGIIDPLIAACGLRRNLPIVTGNTRHFDFIRQAGFDIKMENWKP